MLLNGQPVMYGRSVICDNYFLGLYILMGQAIEYYKKCITTIVCQYNYTQVVLCVIWTGHVASPMS
ncbi:hypothetical protein THICB3330026 [Thiomonas sp. CB3]|nr:hypothetical protein THICB3330026 [Thiomonas sp. CB3]